MNSQFKAPCAYDALLSQSAQALRHLLREPKYLGGESGFIAVLQTWTEDAEGNREAGNGRASRMLHHPHVHILIPAVAFLFARFGLPQIAKSRTTLLHSAVKARSSDRVMAVTVHLPARTSAAAEPLRAAAFF
jgi:hypothetical protein